MENNNQKDTRMYLRVTQSDKKQIVRLAEICGLSQSEYLRQRALGFAPRAVLPDVFFDFNQTLCRLCDEVADNVIYLLNDGDSDTRTVPPLTAEITTGAHCSGHPGWPSVSGTWSI